MQNKKRKVKSPKPKRIMAFFTSWKLIRIKHSPAKLASNTNLNMIQFHLENKSKIKWFFKKYPHKRWPKPNTDKYIHRKLETWANLEKKKIFFFFLFGGLLWPELNPPTYSFQGKKIVFFRTTDKQRTWQSFPAPRLPCHQCFLGEESEVVFQLSGYSCFHGISQMEFLLMLTLAKIFPMSPAA